MIATPIYILINSEPIQNGWLDSNKLLGETSWEAVALDVHMAVDAMYCLGQCTIAAEVSLSY